ncbi:MAG: 16S rRNA (guanine(527)-N(7))-methyltransferase RsmG [Candidatus Accumulibacter sp.]|jgi:16S rRNA (guanine527-N7)-methyltransferase|uniref:16S rRNA (guanine(527)-N(7))-methyltransferase RsmG n=1 Tax=Accumulibacter sp. TaxID=2053492 RepID=UPI001A491B3C|nr:16S rRNA (guanine(527)-N(7))-methyltransferase RsmG [Accumulibacter sp.]MBL8393502.1 16S rRNA (guanine(527)-N(7))-methyltransferase RsmG [Accumulibacter sp.]
MSPGEQLVRGAAILGLDLSLAVQQKLLAYAALLDKWNRTYRLTAVSERARAVSHHLLDSLTVLPFVEGTTLLDVGSGGGMPGIPLAIARPELQVVLLDSNSKKAAFLRQVAIELGLSNIAVHCGRVEAYRPPAGFAVITARAFSDLALLVELSRHLLQDNGRWLAMKGLRPDDEIAGLPADVWLAGVHRLAVPGITGERHLVVMSRDAVSGGGSSWQAYSR